MAIIERPEPPMIYAKMAAILNDIDAVGKTRRNDMQKFNFRGIDEMYNMIHEVMAKHKVFCTAHVVGRQSTPRIAKSGGTMMERILTMKYTFYAEDGSHVDSEIDGEAMDTGDKASNKCMSIAHKYCLLQMFFIPTEEKKDPDEESFDVNFDQRPQAPISPLPPRILSRREQVDKLMMKSGWNFTTVNNQILEICQRQCKVPEMTQQEFDKLCWRMEKDALIAGPPESPLNA